MTDAINAIETRILDALDTLAAEIERAGVTMPHRAVVERITDATAILAEREFAAPQPS